MESPSEIVAKYYQAFDAHKDGWQQLIAEDINFDAPIQKARGKKEFVTMTEQFLHFHRKTQLLERFEQGDSVCSIFKFVMDTPDGQPLTCEVAEWARVQGGRIADIKLLYDPRGFAKAFGL
jgi:ketosteroid isomerase-like protein